MFQIFFISLFVFKSSGKSRGKYDDKRRENFNLNYLKISASFRSILLLPSSKLIRFHSDGNTSNQNAQRSLKCSKQSRNDSNLYPCWKLNFKEPNIKLLSRPAIFFLFSFNVSGRNCVIIIPSDENLKIMIQFIKVYFKPPSSERERWQLRDLIFALRKNFLSSFFLTQSNNKKDEIIKEDQMKWERVWDFSSSLRNSARERVS